MLVTIGLVSAGLVKAVLVNAALVTTVLVNTVRRTGFGPDKYLITDTKKLRHGLTVRHP